MITIQVDSAPITAALNSIHEDQVPFAASLALNKTADAAQAGIRAGMEERFTIRRPWVLQQIKIRNEDRSTKAKLAVTVRVDTPADFLNKFEPGGTKTPRSGGSIAVPITARPSRGAIVPDSLRPKALALHASGGRIIGDQRTFLVTLRSGRRGIFQRTGPGRDGVRLLYWLTPSVPIPADLHFVKTAGEVITERWAVEWEKAWELAVRTAR